MIRDNESLRQMISIEVYKLVPFKKAILVKYDFGGQRPCFVLHT